MLKKEARELFRKKRNELSPSELSRLDDLLLIQFQSVQLPFLETIFTFWPIVENNEPNTHLLVEFLRFRNPELRIAYPVADFSSMTMSAIAVDIDTAFTRKELNIFEPEEGIAVNPADIDLVMVPLLIVDTSGYRVGYGRGFYDKFLKECRPDCLKVGFSYFEPIQRIEDRGDFDVPLNLCITPQNVYVF